jgi:iron(III) transport system ATP-binding protein
MTAVIELENVSLRQGSSDTLTNFSLSVYESETLVLLGPSGCGKTSILRLILGFLPPTAGSVYLRGQVVSRNGKILQAPERRHLGVVFQDLALWPHMTVYGNLAFGLDCRNVSRQEKDERIQEILHHVGLTGKEHRRPAELSGGEQQRVAIARALVLRPQAILFDEPLSNLDILIKRELLALFQNLLSEQKTTAIYVTHDPQEALRLANQIAVMEKGHLVQTGSWQALKREPSNEFVKNLFLEISE